MSQQPSSHLSLPERDTRVIANIARLRFSPLALVGGHGNRLIEEGGRTLLDLGASFARPGAASGLVWTFRLGRQ